LLSFVRVGHPGFILNGFKRRRIIIISARESSPISAATA